MELRDAYELWESVAAYQIRGNRAWVIMGDNMSRHSLSFIPKTGMQISPNKRFILDFYLGLGARYDAYVINREKGHFSYPSLSTSPAEIRKGNVWTTIVNNSNSWKPATSFGAKIGFFIF